MTVLFLDTEFTTLSRQRRLISLALVDPAGPECYVELVEGWTTEDCSDFVVGVVLPQLDLPRWGLTQAAARQRLLDFLAAYPDAQIISDALAWDGPLLLELLAPGGLPAGLSCREIRGLLARLEEAEVPHHALLDARLMAREYAARG